MNNTLEDFVILNGLDESQREKNKLLFEKESQKIGMRLNSKMLEKSNIPSIYKKIDYFSDDLVSSLNSRELNLHKLLNYLISNRLGKVSVNIWLQGIYGSIVRNIFAGLCNLAGHKALDVNVILFEDLITAVRQGTAYSPDIQAKKYYDALLESYVIFIDGFELQKNLPNLGTFSFNSLATFLAYRANKNLATVILSEHSLHDFGEKSSNYFKIIFSEYYENFFFESKGFIIKNQMVDDSEEEFLKILIANRKEEFRKYEQKTQDRLDLQESLDLENRAKELVDQEKENVKFDNMQLESILKSKVSVKKRSRKKQ